MAHFVLIPGAWLSGSVFGPVAEALRALGHQCTSVTPPGLIDHPTTEPDLESWIAHVVNIIDDVTSIAVESSDVILVGHSFSGIVAGSVADRQPERLQRLIYLDANLPVDGESFAASWTTSGQQWLADQIASNAEGRWIPDLDPSETLLSAGDQVTLLQHASSMPAAPLYQPAALSSEGDTKVPTTYIFCTGSRPEVPTALSERAQNSDWDLRMLGTGHWPMVSHPGALGALLDDIAL